MQQMVDALGNDAVNDREQRYADRHADKAEQAAEDQNGKHDPEARKAGRVAEDLRAEDIAVDLLKNDDEDNEVQRLKRTCDHDQDRARNSADKRAEERDNVRNTDNDRDQQREGRLDGQQPHRHHDAHTDEAQHADDERVDELAGDEAAKHAVNVCDALDDRVRPLDGEQAVRHFLRLGAEGFLAV